MIRILADESQKAAIRHKGTNEKMIIWVADIAELLNEEADAYFDLQFQAYPERVDLLQQVAGRKLFISSVTETCLSLELRCTRLNAWVGFLARPILELACSGEDCSAEARRIFSILCWNYVELDDQPGFISARVIAMIINEAYLALQDGVSSKDEIDLAMKTGTNYPYGPFEWAASIGMKNILHLLSRLAETDIRYEPAILLVQEGGKKN